MKKIISLLLIVFILYSSALMYSCDGFEEIEDTYAENAESTAAPTEEKTTEKTTEKTSEDPTKATTETSAETETESTPMHVWNDATCDTPKTCELCGETEGEPVGHKGGLATCSSKAICDVCGLEYGEIGDHMFDAKVIGTKYQKTRPSFTAGAWYFYSCSFCGEKGKTAFNSGRTILTGTAEDYAKLYENSLEGEKFLFFTDPHYITTGEDGKWNPTYDSHLELMKKFYDAVDVSFALCGGDWLNNTNTRENALDMMAQIRGEMDKSFSKAYLVVGNHDYNYQYVKDGVNGRSPYWLTEDEIVEVWFEEYGKTYYTFEGENTKFYVFNSGIDWSHGSLTDLDKEQILWFLEELSKNDDAHIALAPHMVNNTGIHVATDKYAAIGKVYNERGSYEYEGVTYDFSQKTGMVEFIIAGHNHTDSIGELHGIPYILTANAYKSTNLPTFDLIYVDYTERKLCTLRIGTGELGREVELPRLSEAN